MELPATLEFGGTVYKVLYLPQVGTQDLAGQCDHPNSLIKISTDQSLEQMKSTLLHESIHAQAHCMDWHCKEATVIKIEKMVFAMLRANPDLFRLLLGQAKKPNN